ncbi:hypothetical protein [Methylorubrum extorquens]|uniref:hypothetical protein n=1 Tax=Methylorubrum extorquens TaxID=408 RepID=UPI000AFF6732|nr:hypothetical protein [Methylorubrum extorquens]WIU39892.1 hypothetical protein KQ926_00340 [Methylorubrum extorquens]
MITEVGKENLLRAREGTPLETILCFGTPYAKALADEIHRAVNEINTEAKHAQGLAETKNPAAAEPSGASLGGTAMIH